MKKTKINKENKKERKILNRIFFNKITLFTSILIIVLALALSSYAATVRVQNGALNVSNNLLVNSNTLFADSANNKVGIGTTTPKQKLDVNGALLVQDNINSTGTATLGTRGASGSRNTLNLYSDAPRLLFSTAATTPNWKISAQDDINKALEIAVGRNTDDDAGDDTFIVVMQINNDTYTGFGGTPSTKLHVQDTIDGDVLRLQDSDGTCNHNPEAGSETVACTSDRKLKTDIINITSKLGKFMNMNIREYTVIASSNRRTGVIAQEINITNPEMVHDINGTLFVEQPNLWELVKAIQELKSENDLLKRRVAVLEGR